MLGLKTLLVAALSVVSVVASPTERRQSCAATCGNNCYTNDDINAALNQGYGYYQNGEQVGRNDYPHAFDDREGFDISVQGPWQEFPILSSGNTYSGGSPGADRVVFNTDGQLAIMVTHSGASGNNFVQCN